MRRIAKTAAILILISGTGIGCRSIHRPWAKTAVREETDHPLAEPRIRTARDAVPDSIMLPNQLRAGYNDFPAAQ